MVGDTYEVVVTKYAKQRRQRIFDFETRVNDLAYARRLVREVSTQIKRLATFPSAHPLLPDHGQPYELRYVKAHGYKIVYRIYEEDLLVSVRTIRKDNEEPAVVFADL